MRHFIPGLAERMAWEMNYIGRPVPLINAGSGRDQHPTQALFDIYTLHRSFEREGGIDGRIIVMVGDLKRGRTVRSLSYLLTKYEKITIWFVSPPELQMEDDIKDYLRENGVRFEETDDLEKIIPEADVVYMTRIQKEWDKENESSEVDYSRYYFKVEYLDILGPNSAIMHPLPRVEEIPQEVDKDRRAVYWRQVRNGMHIRTALIAIIFGKDREILDY